MEGNNRKFIIQLLLT